MTNQTERRATAMRTVRRHRARPRSRTRKRMRIGWIWSSASVSRPSTWEESSGMRASLPMFTPTAAPASSTRMATWRATFRASPSNCSSASRGRSSSCRRSPWPSQASIWQRRRRQQPRLPQQRQHRQRRRQRHHQRRRQHRHRLLLRLPRIGLGYNPLQTPRVLLQRVLLRRVAQQKGEQRMQQHRRDRKVFRNCRRQRLLHRQQRQSKRRLQWSRR
mmetsp:Transcript_6777/g.14821  ORF Transcript_6777/g.14821 Transcript_6777/m.14821 type:complete len:218 (+) Transcript_6777:730-1383(+)